MKERGLWLTVGALAFLSCVLAPQPARARSVGAMAGNTRRPLGNTGSNCLSETNGGVANTCAPLLGSVDFLLGLPIDAAVSYTVAFESTSGTSCAVLVHDAIGLLVGVSGFGTSAGNLVTLTSANVPPGGVLYLYCQIPSHGALYSVNWF